MIAKDCTERLSNVALSRGLSERVVRGSFFSQIHHRNAFIEIAWEDAEPGLGMVIVVYRQRVLQTVTSLGVVSLVFRGHDLLESTNFNPQQEARFSLWKKLAPRESGGNGV